MRHLEALEWMPLVLSLVSRLILGVAAYLP